MPKKKEETTMLVRSVPLDVSERIRRFCRKGGIRYREFLERAIDQLEGTYQEQVKDSGQEEGAQEKVSLIERVAKIAETVKAYKKAIRLRKDLIAISENMGFLADWEHQAHAYLEVAKMKKELDDIMKQYIPKDDTPDDPKEREAMGFPDESLIPYLVTAEEAEERKRHNEEADTRWEMSEEEIREEFRKLNQKSSAENLMAGLKPDEDSAKTLIKQDRVRYGVAASAEPYQGPAEDEPEPEPGKEQIKATKSGTGSGDGAEE